MKIILILLLSATLCYATNLEATGSDYVKLSNNEKVELVTSIIAKLNADVDVNSSVEALNLFYIIAKEDTIPCFDITCLEVFKDMLAQ